MPDEPPGHVGAGKSTSLDGVSQPQGPSMVAYEFLRFGAADVRIDVGQFAQLPESARTTFEAILREGPSSVQRLRKATGLSPRTIRFGLHRLCQLQLVDTRRNLTDARTSSYFVHPSRVLADSLHAARSRADKAVGNGPVFSVAEVVAPRHPLGHVVGAMRLVVRMPDAPHPSAS